MPARGVRKPQGLLTESSGLKGLLTESSGLRPSDRDSDATARLARALSWDSGLLTESSGLLPPDRDSDATARLARALSWIPARHARCFGARPMTAPRQILAGTTYMVTRRCAQRQFLLKPRPVVNEAFLYLLAVAAHRYGVEVHAYCVLSNHYHLVVTDREARLPEFHQFLDALLARSVNASLGRWEAFWAPNSYSAVALTSPTDILDKAAYVLANPVAAGLVRHGCDWPGLRSNPGQIGAEGITARRPAHFFDPKGSMPTSEELHLTAPPGFGSIERFRAELSAAVANLEDRARLEMGGAVLGVAGVLAQKPTARPRPGEPRRGLNPRVACRDKWKRIEVLARLREFLSAYRAAWRAWCADEPDVRFPAGTYQLRVLHGAPCIESG